MILPLLLSAVLLAEAPPPSMDEIQLWLTYYYLKPRPELTLPSLAVIDRQLQKQGRSLGDEANRGGMRSFYAQVFARNPSVVEKAASILPSLSAGQQAFVSEALRRCAARHCADALKAPVSQPEAPTEKDPSALDDLWGAYFATGEAWYVMEIIDALKGAQVAGDVNRLATASAAQWSLSSNAYQHASVLAICEDAAAASTGATRDVLQVLVAQAKAQRASNPPPEPGLSVGGGPARVAPEPTASPQWPAGVPKPNLAGFWKNDCAEDFGLKIAPAGKDLYSISFCGPGGCFEPGSYRPDSAIFGDPLYRVKDANTIEVLGSGGFSTSPLRRQALRRASLIRYLGFAPPTWYSPLTSKTAPPVESNVPLHVPLPVNPLSLPVPPVKVQVHVAVVGAPSFTAVVPPNWTKYVSPLASVPTP